MMMTLQVQARVQTRLYKKDKSRTSNILTQCKTSFEFGKRTEDHVRINIKRVSLTYSQYLSPRSLQLHLNMTPRKTQQQQRQRRPRTTSNLGNQQILPSDYESEAPYVAPSTTRSNTELNLRVLQRYSPSITTILSIAPSAVIYNFLPSDQTWEKAELDGTLFVCQMLSAQAGGKERYCIIILNKRGLENMIVDMAEVRDVEISTEFLILRWADGEEEKIQGVYIHADKEDTREVNCRLIKECWESVNATGNGIMDGEVSSFREEVFP